MGIISVNSNPVDKVRQPVQQTLVKAINEVKLGVVVMLHDLLAEVHIGRGSCRKGRTGSHRWGGILLAGGCGCQCGGRGWGLLWYNGGRDRSNGGRVVEVVVVVVALMVVLLIVKRIVRISSNPPPSILIQFEECGNED